MKECNMHPTPNNPCLFIGKPDRIHTMYIALYVDDFVYFSPNRDTWIAFENTLKSLTNVDFMGQVTHFLGIKFNW